MNDKQALYYAVAELRKRGLFPPCIAQLNVCKPVVDDTLFVVDPDTGDMYDFRQLERR